MTLTGLIIFLVIGAIAGWIAGQIMSGGGFGLVGDIVVGVIGALIGGWLLGLFGISVGGLIGSIVAGHRCDHPPSPSPGDQARLTAVRPARGCPTFNPAGAPLTPEPKFRAQLPCIALGGERRVA